MAFRFAFVALCAAVVMSVASSALADSAAAPAAIDGVWRNPKNSVHVELRPCGAGKCGYVVWASAKAQADARKGGSENLVGLQLLRDFTPDKSGAWRGKVFVPDLNATLSGTAELISADALRARGCLLKIICKSQIWSRIDNAAG